MKSERINNVILFVSVIVFILQSVGYFAPAWFIKEIVVNLRKDGMIADGRTFKLPYWDEFLDDDMQPNDDNGRMTQETDNVGEEMILDKDVRQTISSISVSADMSSTSSSEMWPSPVTESTPYSVLHREFQDGTETDGKEYKKKKMAYVLYLSAGLWYCRACIYLTDNGSRVYGNEDRIEWCALYVRTDDRTLERKKNMFEFRIETTAALALSVLSLLLASTGCCSHRRHGTRAIASLSTMFLSGAAMAVPVVHIIIEYMRLHGNIMSRRGMGHHLFDHYSVIICAVASILSIVSTVIITIIKCRNNSEPSDWYDVTHDDKKKREHSRELPDSWLHNTKVALPVVTKIKDDVRDETESGYCEMKEEEPPGSCTESVSAVCQNDTNEFGQLELVASELETFEM